MTVTKGQAAEAAGGAVTASPGHCLIIGSSDGIGRALVEVLLTRGWYVTGLSRSPTIAAGERFTSTVCDVAKPDYPAVVQNIVAGARPVTAVVYCAGIGEPLDLDRLANDRLTFEVNTMGAIDAFAAAMPVWRRLGRGHFVMLSSLADELPSADCPAYNASKAAGTSYFESMALALRSTDIAVSNVRFGFVDTKMAKAPFRPFMLSRGEAVEHLITVLNRRPVRLSRPFAMVAAVKLLGWVLHLRALIVSFFG